jgi:hypothetical protein
MRKKETRPRDKATYGFEETGMGNYVSIYSLKTFAL